MTTMHMEVMVESTSKKSLKDAARGIPAPLVSHTACHLATPVRKTTHVGLVTCEACIALVPQPVPVVVVAEAAAMPVVVVDRLAGAVGRKTRQNAPTVVCAFCPATFKAWQARVCVRCHREGKRLPKTVQA